MNKAAQVKLGSRTDPRGFTMYRLTVPSSLIGVSGLEVGEYLNVTSPAPGQLLFDGGEREAKPRKAKAKTKAKAKRRARQVPDAPGDQDVK